MFVPLPHVQKPFSGGRKAKTACGRELAGGLCYVLSLRHDGIAMTARSDEPQIEQRPCRCVLQSMETA